MTKITPIPKDTLFVVTNGAWDDYELCGVFRANEDIDVEALKEDWLIEHPKQGDQYHFDDRCLFEEEKFLAYIISKGLAETIDVWTLHLADYSSISEMRVIPSVERWE